MDDESRTFMVSDESAEAQINRITDGMPSKAISDLARVLAGHAMASLDPMATARRMTGRLAHPARGITKSPKTLAKRRAKNKVARATRRANR